MSTVTNTATYNDRFNGLTLIRSTEDSTPTSTHDHLDFYLEADEIASRLAEIKSKWTASEQAVRATIGRARRDRLVATIFRCNAS